MTIDAFAEAERLVDEVGARPPGSDAERRAAKLLTGRLEELGREVEIESFPVWPAWATGYAINAGLAVVGSVLAVSSAVLGTALVLAAAILTFLDLSGIFPTTRRLLGRRASQNVISWGDRDKPGHLFLVAHYDSGPARTRPLRPMFLALLVLLACCVLRVAGMEGIAITIAQFIPTVALILYVAALLDLALSAPAAGENDNASGVGLALKLAERLGTELNYFGVHVLFTGSQKAMAQGMRAFLKAHKKEFPQSDTAFVNLHAVGAGDVHLTAKEGPLLAARAHATLLAQADAGTTTSREPSDGYAAASAGFPAVTIIGEGERLEEDALAAAEELAAQIAEGIDEELS
jgi:Peptidase family M28